MTIIKRTKNGFPMDLRFSTVLTGYSTVLITLKLKPKTITNIEIGKRWN